MNLLSPFSSSVLMVVKQMPLKDQCRELPRQRMKSGREGRLIERRQFTCKVNK